MKIGKLTGYWMALVGILFCMTESKAENGLTFDTGRIMSAGIEMPYRVAHCSGAGKTALVIYLHGGSSKGNDNTTQMGEAGIDSIAGYLESRQMEALFVVPQCPSDKSWGGPMLGVLKALIDRYVREGSVDASSLYIFGGSMGGTGTWSMLSAYPGLFAAAMPVAGNPSKCDADNVSLTPVYTVMGTADRIMNVDTTSDFINQLDARNGITRFDIEEGWTHEMTCIESYTTPRLDWVFDQGGNDPSAIESPTAYNRTTSRMEYYATDGRRLPDAPAHGLYIQRCIHTDGSVTSQTLSRR